MHNKMEDREFLERKFKAVFHRKLNLKNPQTINEKLQWLKLYNRNPKYTQYVDKYLVREYIKETIGEEYLIPLIGVWDNADDIEFDKLPNQFVLKCNHNSGTGMYICKNKENMDCTKVISELKKGLKQDYYLTNREWPYKNVKPRIIAETYIENKEEIGLKDYKFMCFNGKVKCSFVCTNRNSKQGLSVDFFDLNWKKMPFTRHYPNSGEHINKPINYNQMLQLAEKLAKNIPFVRVDFYEVNRKIYFGELTFYPGAGFEEFSPEKYDRVLGEWLDLPEICNN